MSAAAIEQFAGKAAARAARRRAIRRGELPPARGAAFGVDRRPGWITYTLLAVIFLVSCLPMYYAILLASSDGTTIAANPLPSLPHTVF